MKKGKILSVLLILVMLLASCNSMNTVYSKEKVQKLTEEFYAQLENADGFTMKTYDGGQLFSIFTKDRDKYHVEYPGSYDYYCFIKDGRKYTIADDGTLFEEDTTYDMSADMISSLLQIRIYGYFEVEDELLSFMAFPKDNELVTSVSGKYEGTDYTITTTGIKDNGRISSITIETDHGDGIRVNYYEFEYGKHVELPEYTEPKVPEGIAHVESPYKTYSEIIEKLNEKDVFTYVLSGDQFAVVAEKDGRYYQFSSTVGQDLIGELTSLDIFDEQYEKQLTDLMSNVEIEDCIDFTSEIKSDEELSAYAGKKMRDLIADGYKISGYSFFGDDNYISADNGLITYVFEVDLPEGFDSNSEFEYSDLDECTVKSGTFDSVQLSAFPIK